MNKEEQLKLAQAKAKEASVGNNYSSKKNRLLNDTLNRIVTQDDAKRARTVMEALVSKAEDGDTRAIDIVLDRLEGKVQNDTKISGDNDAPVIIQVITGIDDNDMIESLDDD